jgi:hypothetical protein
MKVAAFMIDRTLLLSTIALNQTADVGIVHPTLLRLSSRSAILRPSRSSLQSSHRHTSSRAFEDVHLTDSYNESQIGSAMRHLFSRYFVIVKRVACFFVNMCAVYAVG